MTDQIVSIGTDETEVSLQKEGSGWRVTAPGRSDAIEIIRVGGGEAELRMNGERIIVPFVIDAQTVHFAWQGETYSVTVSEKIRGRRPKHRDHSTSAPMPGAVVKIFVTVGDVVLKGAPLLVLEAMKMEHEITAPFSGRIKAVLCAAGQLVQPGIDLVTIDPEELE